MAYTSIKPKQLKSGKIRFQVKIRQKNKGVESPAISKTFDTQSEAEQFAAQEMQKLTQRPTSNEQDELILFKNYEEPKIFLTLADVMTWKSLEFEAAPVKYGRSTIAACKMPLKYDIASVPPNALDYTHLENYCRDRLANGASASTISPEIQRIVAAVKEVARTFPEQNIPIDNLDFYTGKLKKAGYISKANKRKRRFKKGEAEKLFIKAKEFEAKHRTNLPYSIIIELLIETCLRLSELFNIKKSDLDFDNNTIRIATLKRTNRQDQKTDFSAKMTESAMHLFQRLMVIAPSSDDVIFPVKSKTFSKYFTKLRNETGLVDFRLHDLRREGVSRKFEEGYNVVQIAKLFTGHKDLSVLAEIYIELDAQNALHSKSAQDIDISTSESADLAFKYLCLKIKPQLSDTAWNEVLTAFFK